MKGAKTPLETIVDGHDADPAVLADVIYRAFKNLAPSRVLVTDPAMMDQVLPRTFALDVEDAQRDGIVYTTDRLRAVALWVARSGKVEPEPVPDARLRQAAGRFAPNFEAFNRTLSARHPIGRAYHHLWIVAVHPDSQRCGLGTRTIQAHHDYLDAHGLPAYLEAASLRLRDYYQDLGYKVFGEPIILADGSTPMHAMWREPHPPPGGFHANG